MKNKEIIKKVCQRYYKGNLLQKLDYFQKLIKDHDKKKEEYLQYKNEFGDIYKLIAKLSKPNYIITEEDIKLLRDYNVLVSEINKSFVAISDFHSYSYPLDKVINNYLNEYDCIYILGDACDRGEDGKGSGGIDLILRIKDLCEKYPNRVYYLPGNHDEFLVGYCLGIESYHVNLQFNCGLQTIEDINNLKKNNPFQYESLLKWLMECPIQKIHRFNGKNYVLAHALFNQKLYEYNPNYSLKDYFKGDNCFYEYIATNTLWFRKGEDLYEPKNLPTSEDIMVIGHTPDFRKDNLDLIGSDGKNIKVHCVDGGIAYSGTMLKYDGGLQTNKTRILTHRNTSIKKQELNKKVLYHDYILGEILKNKSFDLNIENLPNGIDKDDCCKIIDESENTNNIIYTGETLSEKNNSYAKTFVFDYMIERLAEFVNEEYSVNNPHFIVDSFLFGTEEVRGNLCCFSEDKDIRMFASILGKDNMLEVLKIHNCSIVHDYIALKFNNNNLIKTKSKYVVG